MTMGWRLRFCLDIFLFNKFAEKASLTRDSCSYICVSIMFFVCWVGHLQSADSRKKNYFSIGTNIFFLKREVNFCVCSSFLYLFCGCIYCINFLFLWYIFFYICCIFFFFTYLLYILFFLSFRFPSLFDVRHGGPYCSFLVLPPTKVRLPHNPLGGSSCAGNTERI